MRIGQHYSLYIEQSKGTKMPNLLKTFDDELIHHAGGLFKLIDCITVHSTKLYEY